MIAYFLSKEFCTDWIALAQSYWFPMERPLNFFNQYIGSWNIGPSKIRLADWLRSLQILKCSTSKLPKIISARCWRPGLFNIFSNILSFLYRLGLICGLDDFSILVERIVSTYLNLDVKNCGHFFWQNINNFFRLW